MLVHQRVPHHDMNHIDIAHLRNSSHHLPGFRSFRPEPGSPALQRPESAGCGALPRCHHLVLPWQLGLWRPSCWWIHCGLHGGDVSGCLAELRSTTLRGGESALCGGAAVAGRPVCDGGDGQCQVRGVGGG